MRFQNSVDDFSQVFHATQYKPMCSKTSLYYLVVHTSLPQSVQLLIYGPDILEMLVRFMTRIICFFLKVSTLDRRPTQLNLKRKHKLKPRLYSEPPNINHCHTKLFTSGLCTSGLRRDFPYFLALIINNLTSGYPEIGSVNSFKNQCTFNFIH